ncbi:HIT family protein [soil metagenome]
MATIFTRIIQGEIPGTFVWRDDLCVSFMSINPLRHGHTLVVPISEIDHWIDCPDDIRDHLFDVAQRVARAQQAAFRPARVGLMIAGLEVSHLHLHVVPIDGAHDLDFGNAAPSVDPADLERAAEAIRHSLRAAGEPGAA